MKRLVQALASMRLTVALLGLAMVLIFVGTLAQTRLGVWQVVDTYFRAPIAWVDLGVFAPTSVGVDGVVIPLPGGLLLGMLLLVNLVFAHAHRWKALRRRPALILVHSGLIVLLLGEILTGVLADEGLMRIDEGEHAWFVEDIRAVELALVDRSAPQFDRELTVPAVMLRESARSGRLIADSRLPVTIRVERWFPNAVLVRSPHATASSPATTGLGLEATPDPVPTGRGVDGANADMPAAYVTLARDDQPLGTWLVWAGLDESQSVTIDGRTYTLALRFVRSHLPFALELIDFQHSTFPGTTIARDFSSHLRLVDPERRTDRRVRIWMNNPLRYRGLAFYQASYKPDGTGTVLQVVRNPAWTLPYVSCGMVGVGLLWHFMSALAAFLGRRGTAASQASRGTLDVAGRTPRYLARSAVVVAWVLIGVILGIGRLFTPSPTPELDTVARLPVLADGRIKPMDTAARNVLMVAGGRSVVRAKDTTVGAVQFMLDLVTRPEAVRDLPVVRVDDPGVLALLGLSPDDGGRLRLSAIEPHWREIATQAESAAELPPSRRDPFQRAVIQLHARVNLVLAHARLHQPFLVAPLAGTTQWRSFHEAFLDEAARFAGGLPSDTGAVSDAAPQPHPSIAYFTTILSAYSEGDRAGFARAVKAYDDLLARDLPDARRRAHLEALFNRSEPFVGTMAVYVLGALLLLASFLLGQMANRGAGRINAPSACRCAALGLLWGGVIVHTAAIGVRMFLQDRPPVTNLYSSAIFVGWAGVLVGLLVERLVPIGLPALAAASVGVGTLVVAHNLGSDGDTLQMMQAVLDSNFWLATHVVTITLGYSATFLAGGLGALSIMLGVLAHPNPARERSLAKAIYAVVCFALLLSFVGTVLGGIWADQSWGRFWGWDPKENGAALVVLMNAMILHARWGGLARARGIAVLAVGGNIVTAWSWFGTNMLGVGLHSYGFMDSAALWIGLFALSQVALIALGSVRRPLIPDTQTPLVDNP